MYVRLFSPQTHHQIHCAHSIIKIFNVKMLPKNHNNDVPISRHEYNSPKHFKSYVTSAQKKRHGPLLRLGMAFISWDYLDLFGDLRTDEESSGTEG